MAKRRVFADTNVVIEAFRTGCWTALCERYDVETVEKCVEEALTGNPDEPRHVAISAEDLNAGLANQHPVSRGEIATLVLAFPCCGALDDGEKHLLARLHADKSLPAPLLVVSTADKAALVASHQLGWLDSLASLEVLAREAGASNADLIALHLQYREDWLVGIKTKIRLGIIP